MDQGSNCVVCRRFLATDHLSVLLDYLTSEGYRRGHYKVGFLLSLTYNSPTDLCSLFKVLSSWPRRDLTQLANDSSLLDLKLCPQETLTLEQINTGDSDSE